VKIAVVGATGLTGSRIVPEAASRGHRVTAISRHPEKTPPEAHVTAVACDVFDTIALAKILSGHDVVIYAYSPRNDHATNRSEPHRMATVSVIAATKQASVPRLLAVGGAGTLKTLSGVRLMDTPEFPPAYRESAISTAQVLSLLKEEPHLDWAFISPAASFAQPDLRTGKYRLGKDQMLVDAEGRSELSQKDLAVAIIDDVEQWRHSRQRFSVAY
jgi:putative NADH-flavin reductase